MFFKRFARFRENRFYSEELVKELNLELIEKARAAAPGFFMGSVWVYVQHFESVKYIDELSILAICLAFFSLIRLAISKMYDRKIIEIKATVRLTKMNIVLNGFLWSCTLMLPIIEFQFTHLTASIAVISMLMALTISSVITISYNMWVAYYFQWVVAAPPAVYLYYLWHSTGNTSAFNAAVLISILLIYLFHQTRGVHFETIRRISYALDLETSNKLLLESQDLLIQEKVKLQHSIKLAAIGEISAEIAHEINNPLGIIMGYIELSLDLLRSNSPDVDVLQAQLIKANSAISRITKIIKGLRHYSRRTNDDPMVPVYINEIIEDAVEFCSEKFSYNKTVLEIENPQDFRIFCRPIEISQVLLNIFSNAIDEVSKLDPEMRKMKVQVAGTKEHVQILISNFGPKIKTDIQDKLFEPFFSTKKVGIGTGLGLSISRGIIESYKGRLYYDPAHELTTFVIELPQHL